MGQETSLINARAANLQCFDARFKIGTFRNVRKIAKATISFRDVFPSVRIEQLSSDWTVHDVGYFSENFSFINNQTRITFTLH
jgi:hypothetical protein